jgi:molybdopterin molybdotransferase
MTLSLASALTIIEGRCQAVTDVEKVGLSDARMRILADSVVAAIDVPAARNSAVDGYGLRHADLAQARRSGLLLVGTAAAGRSCARTVGPGECVRIFTGAVPPSGVDTVAMQEMTALAGERVMLSRDIAPGANIREAGEDIARGRVVLENGRLLGPFELGVLASVGVAAIPVRKRLRVAVLSAGDELVDPGHSPGPGLIFDANRPVLSAMLGRMGFAAHDLGIMADDRQTVVAALRRAAGACDAIVTSAGVSVGDEDHLRGAIETLGALDFTSVAIKPGKPVSFGHVQGIPIFALPGNPVAMIVTFLMLARPGLMRLAGAGDRPILRFPAAVDFSLVRRPGLREFLRCSLAGGPDGPIATRYPRGGSGILSSMSDSDGFIELPEDLAELRPGMRMPFLPFSAFGL